jgi:SAM-dependent methyltransferase
MLSKSLVDRLYARFYGDGSRSGTLLFYNWLRNELRPEMTVLNLGAGPPTRNPTRVLKGEVKRLIGADIDPIVLENPELDEARLIEGDALPFDSGEFDAIFADYVLEHIEQAERFLTEVFRVLRRGGAFYFRTPSRYHYVVLASRLTPHWFHVLVANRMRGLPVDEHEPWPTFYRLNSTRALVTTARRAGFSAIELRFAEPEPSYLVFNSIAFLLGVAYERTVNRWQVLSPLRANIFGRLTK